MLSLNIPSLINFDALLTAELNMTWFTSKRLVREANCPRIFSVLRLDFSSSSMDNELLKSFVKIPAVPPPTAAPIAIPDNNPLWCSVNTIFGKNGNFVYGRQILMNGSFKVMEHVLQNQKIIAARCRKWIFNINFFIHTNDLFLDNGMWCQFKHCLSGVENVP